MITTLSRSESKQLAHELNQAWHYTTALTQSQVYANASLKRARDMLAKAIMEDRRLAA